MKIEKLAVGMTIYECHSYKMGNTTLRSWGVWSARVIEIDLDHRKALISWNSNPPRWLYQAELARYKDKEPVLIKSGMIRRKPTREELKEIKAQEKAA